MKFTSIFTGLSILLMITSSLFLTRCNSRKTSKNPTPNTVTVKTQTDQTRLPKKILSVNGNIEGNKTVRFGFMVADKIDKISTEEGQTVKSGQLLASLDPEKLSDCQRYGSR